MSEVRYQKFDISIRLSWKCLLINVLDNDKMKLKLKYFFPGLYSEKSENIIGLESYILNSFNYLSPF